MRLNFESIQFSIVSFADKEPLWAMGRRTAENQRIIKICTV